MTLTIAPENHRTRQHDKDYNNRDRSKRIKLSKDCSPESLSAAHILTSHPKRRDRDNDKSIGVNEDVESSEVSESSDEPSGYSSINESEESDIDGEDKGKIINLQANRGKKPRMRLDDGEIEDVRPFLKRFLPKLKEANDKLQAEQADGTLKTLELPQEELEGVRDSAYIEMNLGLGVFESKENNAHRSSDFEDEDNGEGDDTNILGKLMGQDKTSVDPGIQVVNEQS